METHAEDASKSPKGSQKLRDAMDALLKREPATLTTANDINQQTIAAQQQEITRLRSLKYLYIQQAIADANLFLAAASWLRADEDEICIGPDLLHTLLENGADFSLYIQFATQNDPIGMLRYRCGACRETTCGYAGVQCASASDPNEVMERRMPKRFAAAFAKAADIRKRFAGMVE